MDINPTDRICPRVGVFTTFHVQIAHNFKFMVHRNCPKYINTRDLVPAPCSPHVRSSSFSDDNVSRSVLLPEEAVDAIGRADLVFLATVYRSVSKNESRDPSRLGANSRGGPPGFVRVTTENGRSVIYLPDYSGNR